MHLQFKFEMDKLDSLNYPNFLEEEIDLLLNQAQDRFVKQRYSKNNVKKESYEETQKRIEDLKAITLQANLAPQIYSINNIDVEARFVILPTDHWFIVQERCIQSYTDCNGVVQTHIVEVRPIQHSEFSKIIKDPFKRPSSDKVLRLMSDSQVELITAPNTTITGYTLRYIKRPVRVSLSGLVDCELSEHTHEEIVNEAVKIALEGIEAKRTPTFTPIIDSQKE
jgi:hypothetical protein